MRIAFSAVALLSVVAPLQAADLPRQSPPPAPIGFEGPTFSLTAYLWGSALTGKQSTLPPLPPVNVDMSFGDILKDLNGAIMGAGELRIDRWGFVLDAMFTQVTPEAQLPGPYFSSVKVRSRSLTLQASILYRLYAGETVDFDIGGGVRYWNLDNKLKILPGDLNLRIDYSEAEDWFDPVISARLITRLGGPWSLTLMGDIGGFDVGSRLTWQALGSINYELNENWTFRAGYRALSVDYRDGRFLYDVTMHGPVLAATYRF